MEIALALVSGAELLVKSVQLLDLAISRSKEINQPGLKRSALRVLRYLEGLKDVLPRVEKEIKSQPRFAADLEASLLELNHVIERIQRAPNWRLVFFKNNYKENLEDAYKHLKDMVQLYKLGALHGLQDQARQDAVKPPSRDEMIAQDQEEQEHYRELIAHVKEFQRNGDASVKRAGQLFLDQVEKADSSEEALYRIEKGDANDTIVCTFESFATSVNSRFQTITRATFQARDIKVDEQKLFGRGSFGEVLSATIVKTGEIVAVKRVPMRASEIRLKEQNDLLSEAQIWETLQNANIVELKGTCVQNNCLLLVMEMCEMSLKELLYDHGASSPLGADEYPMIIRGLARGLDFLHSRNVIHRDIKPENILLNRSQGKVKIADFGLAFAKSGSASHVQTFSIKGSLCYMAPEVLATPAIWTTRSDIWALGIVSWEILHRQSPWPEQSTTQEMCKRIIEGPIPEMNDDIVAPLWILQMIERCLQRDLQERPYASDLVKFIEKKTRGRRSTKRIKDILTKAVGRLSFRSKQQDLSTVKEQVTFSSLLTEASLSNLSNDIHALEQLAQALCSESFDIDSDRVPVKVRERRQLALDANIVEALKPVLISIKTERDEEKAFFCLQVVAFVLRTRDKAHIHSAMANDFGIYTCRIMRLFPKSARVQENACGAIISLACANVDARKNLMKMGAGKEIISAMQKHQDSAGVQGRACGAIVNLAWGNVDAKKNLMKMGAGKEIISAMQKHQDSAGVQEKACGAIQHLAWGNVDAKKNLMKMGAGKEIISAMQKHQDSAGVQGRACGAIVNLAWGNVDAKKNLMKMGAGKEIISAMQKHQDSAGVQEYACGAIQTLAYANVDIRKNFMKMGAGKEILSAMQKHQDSAGVQERACGAILSFAYREEKSAKALIEMGADEDVLKALRVHTKNHGVAKFGLWALKDLTKYDKDLKRLMVEGYGLAKVLDEVRVHFEGDKEIAKCLVYWRK